MMGSSIMRGIEILSMLVGLLAWSGTAHAAKPNPPGNQGERFVVLGTGDVLDRTTSLRWQQDPAVDVIGSPCDEGEHCPWEDAVAYCADLGGGYRLPEIKELISLVDYSVPSPGAALGTNGPFTDVHPTGYWSATANAGNAAEAWTVFFSDGHVEFRVKDDLPFHAWCVR